MTVHKRLRSHLKTMFSIYCIGDNRWFMGWAEAAHYRWKHVTCKDCLKKRTNK